MPNISVKTEFAKNLDITFSEADSLNSYQELQNCMNDEAPPSDNEFNGENETNTEYATPPGSSNFDTKTAAVIGIITTLSASPLFLKLFEGGDLKEFVLVAVDLVKSNIWVIAILGAIYLLRETIHSALKQWTFGKVIDAKADPNKNNVEIKTEPNL